MVFIREDTPFEKMGALYEREFRFGGKGGKGGNAVTRLFHKIVGEVHFAGLATLHVQRLYSSFSVLQKAEKIADLIRHKERLFPVDNPYQEYSASEEMELDELLGIDISKTNPGELLQLLKQGKDKRAVSDACCIYLISQFCVLNGLSLQRKLQAAENCFALFNTFRGESHHIMNKLRATCARRQGDLNWALEQSPELISKRGIALLQSELALYTLFSDPHATKIDRMVAAEQYTKLFSTFKDDSEAMRAFRASRDECTDLQKKTIFQLNQAKLKMPTSLQVKEKSLSSLDAETEKGMILLESLFYDKSLKPDELVQLGTFLEKHMGDKKLNRKLQSLSKISNKRVIQEMRYFTHKTATFETIQKLTQKLQVACAALKNEQSLSDKEKFTLGEFGVLARFVHSERFSKIMKTLLDAGLNGKTGFAFGDFYQELKTNFAFLEDAFQKQAGSIYQSGDIAIDDMSRGLLVNPQLRGITHQVVQFFTDNLGHAAFMVLDHEKKVTVSHVWTTHRTDRVGILDTVQRDVWRLDLKALVPTETWGALKSRLKLDDEALSKHLQGVYRTAAEALHSSGSSFYHRLKNQKSAQIKSIVADFFKLHKKAQVQDFDALAHRFAYESQAEDVLICSAFVSKSIVAGIAAVNAAVKEQTGIEAAVEMPFSAREKLEYMHPKRLLEKLQKRNCISQVPLPPIIQQLFTMPSQ